MHSLCDGSQVRVSLAADEEMVSWQARLVLALDLFSPSERVSHARGHRSAVGDSLQPIAEDPELTKGQSERTCVLLDCSRPCAPVPVVVFVNGAQPHKQTPDIAGGVHVGKDELDVDAGDQCIWFGYAGDETGETNVRSLMIGLGAVSEKAILYEPKLGAVVTTFRTSCFEVETVHREHLSFSVWSVGGQDKVRLLWRHFYQGTNGLLSGVNSNDRDRVEDAKEELNKND